MLIFFDTHTRNIYSVSHSWSNSIKISYAQNASLSSSSLLFPLSSVFFLFCPGRCSNFVSLPNFLSIQISAVYEYRHLTCQFAMTCINDMTIQTQFIFLSVFNPIFPNPWRLTYIVIRIRNDWAGHFIRRTDGT